MAFLIVSPITENYYSDRLLFPYFACSVFSMTHTPTPSESQANLTIPEIISAIAGVQALIVADVKSPLYDARVQEQLGTAYAFLTEALSKRAIRLTMYAI